jgi:hydroxymethylbilane synthase
MLIRIGTRKSPLALAQANQVRDKLLAAWPQLQVKLVEIITSGDKFLQQPLSEIGGKGLFTKEIEEALLARTIDCAVHSMKDVPTVLPEGLGIVSMLEREDVRDMLIGEGITSLADLPQGAVVGTSSLRRSVQLKRERPDLQIIGFRGNVQTRLAKLGRGEARATLLAAAGINRLGMQGQVAACYLPTEQFVPAVAQGAVGVECRLDDAKMQELLAPLTRAATVQAVECERAFLRELDGSCRTPIAAYAQLSGGNILLNGWLATVAGDKVASGTAQAPIEQRVELGQRLASQLRDKVG